jgi:hypothetical protein
LIFYLHVVFLLWGKSFFPFVKNLRPCAKGREASAETFDHFHLVNYPVLVLALKYSVFSFLSFTVQAAVHTNALNAVLYHFLSIGTS